MTGGDDAAIRALTKIFDVLILAVDNELLANSGDLVSIRRNRGHDDGGQG